MDDNEYKQRIKDYVNKYIDEARTSPIMAGIFYFSSFTYSVFKT